MLVLHPFFMTLSTKNVSTLFLKAVLILTAVVALAIVGFSFLPMWNGGAQELPEAVLNMYYLGLIGVYATIVPFLVALLQAFKLLQYIDRNTGFSHASVQALKVIKYCAISMTLLLAAGLPFAYMFAELDDAPGVIVIATAFVSSPLVVAMFAAVLQKLIGSAIDMKTEHDLTI